MARVGRLRKQLGSRRRRLRKAKEWTQQVLAEAAGLDYKYVGAIERGERNVTIDNVEKIAAGLDVEAHQLFLFEEPAELPADRVTEAKIRDLLEHADDERKALMWRVLREIGASEAS